MQSGLKEGSHTCTLLHCVCVGICSNDCCGLCETLTRQFLQIVSPLSKMISPVALQGTRVLRVKNTLMLYNWSGMFLHFGLSGFKKINMAVNMLMFDMEGYFFI